MMTSTLEFTSGSVSDRGLSPSRPQNEDSFLEMPQIGLFAVADGVGGAQAGEVASQMAVEILAEAFVNMAQTADPEDTMRIALDRANEAIFAMAHDLPQLSSMATTIAAIHVAGDMITIGHVGDSRVYRMDGSGKLYRETDDHSLVEEEVRAGRMTAEQALTHPSRNVISRALGADHHVEPEIKCILVKPGERFLLCSDGITRHIPDAELECLMRTSASSHEICGQLKDLCFERGAEDNLTAVIVDFPGGPTAMFPEIEEAEEPTVAGVREAKAPGLRLSQPEAKIAAGSDDDRHIEVVQLQHLDDETKGIAPALAPNEAEAANPIVPEDSRDLAAVPALTNVQQQEYETGRVSNANSLTTYEAVPVEGQGWASRIAIALGLLVLGAGAGLAASYYLLRSTFQPVVQAPTITEQKSNNVVLTSFEERRRLVDADPAGYLIANAASPQTADDHLWLGRALLLTGKFVEAKRQFEESRRLLPALVEPENVKTVAHEIAMGLAIAENPQAVEAFSKQLTPEGAAVEANTNAAPETRNFRRSRRIR